MADSDIVKPKAKWKPPRNHPWKRMGIKPSARFENPGMNPVVKKYWRNSK